MSDVVTVSPPVDKFQSRDELVQFIEQQTASTLEKTLGPGAVRVERRVPWATSGPVGRDSAGYSVLKAAAFALGYLGPDQAKEELHVHQQLRELYQGYGFVPHCGHQSFLVPLATAHLPAFEPHGQKLQQEIRVKMAADAGRFDPDEAEWIAGKVGIKTKALGTISDIAGGSLVSFPVLGELIDLQRNLEVFAAAGAQEVALPPNGRLQFPKLTGGSTAYWVGESTAVTESAPATGNLDLQAKKLGVLVKVNNELLRFASPSAEGLIRLDMARVAALKADLAMLEGTGGTQIKGLLTYSDITTHTAGSPGTDGDTFQAQDVAKMHAALPDGVTAPTAWVMRKDMHAALMSRRADAVSTADAAGLFLFQPMRSVTDPPALELYGTKVVRSGQVSNTRAKGAGSNLTYILLGYFPDWMGHFPDWRVNVRRKTDISRENRPKAPSTLSTVWAGFGPNPCHSVHDSVQPSRGRHRRGRGGQRNRRRHSARPSRANRRPDWPGDRGPSPLGPNDASPSGRSGARGYMSPRTDRRARVR